MLTFKMTQTEYDANFANMTFNGEKTKIEIIDDDENIVKTINISTGGVVTPVKMVMAYNCIGDFKISLRNDDHNGWFICNEERIIQVPQMTNLINAGLGNSTFFIDNGDGKIRIPNAGARALGISGYEVGLTGRIIGTKSGEESHILTESEIPPHLHSMPVGHGHDDLNFNCDYLVSAADNAPSGTFNENHKTNNTGGGLAHNNMQPTIFAGNLFVYLGA